MLTILGVPQAGGAAAGVAPGAAVLGGTITTCDQDDIVTGSKTITVTLTGALTWHVDLGADNAQTTAFIQAFDSAQSEATGWNAKVRDVITFAVVTRTSATVATIVLPATSGFAITATETITATIPASIIVGQGDDLVASPLITVTNVTEAIALTGTAMDSVTDEDIVAGSKTLTWTLTGDQFVATLGADNAITTAFLAAIDSAQAEAGGWDAKVKSLLDYTMLTRNSAQQATLVLPAAADYEITAQETVTSTPPATSLLASSSAVVASPVFTVDTTSDIFSYVCVAPSTYFVAPDGEGDDGGTGSEGDPFATIQHAADIVLPGDCVHMRGGTHTQTDQVRFRRAGVENDLIVYKNYTGEAPLIVGPTDQLGIGEAVFSMFAFGGGDFIPTDFWSVFDGLDVEGGYVFALAITAASYVAVQNCKIHGPGRECVKNNNGSNNNIYRLNEFYDTGQRDAGNADGIDCTSSENVTIEDNDFHDIATWAAYVKKLGSFAIIQRNRAWDCGRGFAMGESTVQYDSICRNNLLWNIDTAPLQNAGGSRCYFYNNTAYNVGQLVPDPSAGQYVAAANTLVGGEEAQGKSIVDGRFMNNIIVINAPDVELVNIKGGAVGAEPADDITQLTMDYNQFYNLDASNYDIFRWYGGAAQDGLATWRTFTNTEGKELETNSAYGDPLFESVDSASADFLKLAAGSPARNAGADLSSGTEYQKVTDDYAGQARPLGGTYDIGAYEYTE